MDSSNHGVSKWDMKKVRCLYCEGYSVKSGFQNGKQRYKCKVCNHVKYT